MDVYYQLGRGFLEPVYQEALQIELTREPFRLKHRKNLRFVTKGYTLEKKYVPDLVCFGQNNCGA